MNKTVKWKKAKGKTCSHTKREPYFRSDSDWIVIFLRSKKNLCSFFTQPLNWWALRRDYTRVLSLRSLLSGGSVAQGVQTHKKNSTEIIVFSSINNKKKEYRGKEGEEQVLRAVWQQIDTKETNIKRFAPRRMRKMCSTNEFHEVFNVRSMVCSFCWFFFRFLSLTLQKLILNRIFARLRKLNGQKLFDCGVTNSFSVFLMSTHHTCTHTHTQPTGGKKTAIKCKRKKFV